MFGVDMNNVLASMGSILPWWPKDLLEAPFKVALLPPFSKNVLSWKAYWTACSTTHNSFSTKLMSKEYLHPVFNVKGDST